MEAFRSGIPGGHEADSQMLEQYYTEHLEQGEDDDQVPLVGGDRIDVGLQQPVQSDNTGRAQRTSTPSTPVSTLGTRVRGPSSRSFDGASESPSSLGALEKIGLAEAAAYEKQVEGQTKAMQTFADGMAAGQKHLADTMAASQKQMADLMAANQKQQDESERRRQELESQRTAFERQKYEESSKERESQQLAAKAQAEFMMGMLNVLKDMKK